LWQSEACSNPYRSIKAAFSTAAAEAWSLGRTQSERDRTYARVDARGGGVLVADAQ
jgi:hypothetical protein